MKSASSSVASWNDALRVLAATSLHPGLRRLLVFDASARDFETMAEAAKVMLAAATGSAVSQVTLAPFHDEDDLWGIGEGLPTGWHRPGLLAPLGSLQDWRLVLIPNLTILSLPAARAALQLLETDLGRLERHGQSRPWSPRLFWLAACPSNAVGQVSLHLLDRFPARLQAGVWRNSTASRATGLRDWLSGSEASHEPQDETIRDLVESLRQSIARGIPSLTEDAIEETINLLAPWETPGIRRQLGLARLAQALACLGGRTQTHPDEVREAANLMKLFGFESVRQATEKQSEPSTPEPARHSTSPDNTESATGSAPPPRPGDQTVPSTFVQEIPTESASDLANEPAEEALMSLSPFPEDQAPVERLSAPLQLTREDSPQRARRGGASVGVRRTNDPAEVAPVPTLFAAAPFQVRRRKQREGNGSSLIVTAADWRARRRAPRPEDLFVLVLDLTACDASDWPGSLLPYVREAYVRRSAVCLILIGAAGAPNELRAERILARNVLAPDILAALNRDKGRATPLASGLEIARETIRDAQYRGRSAILRTQLVVLSDGRGNIPLEASRTGRLSGPVGSQGITDALQIAARLAAMAQVDRIVLDPQPGYGSHLVTLLADSLDARIEAIPRRDPVLEVSA